MCNRARMLGEPETHWGSAAKIFSERPRDNQSDPRELRPKSRNYVVREQDGERAWDVISWDVLGGKAPWPMTNVRNLALPQLWIVAESGTPVLIEPTICNLFESIGKRRRSRSAQIGTSCYFKL